MTIRAPTQIQGRMPDVRSGASGGTLAAAGAGAAGFAKGGAEVHLEPDGDGTRLSYTVHAAIGGKLAQIGARLIDGTAHKMAEEFFASFASNVVAVAPPWPSPVIL